MGFMFIWLECVAVGVLLAALVTACSARLQRRWLQTIWPTLILFLLALKSAAAILVASVLAAHGSIPDWRLYAWSLGLVMLCAAGAVSWRGLRIGKETGPRARDWPRARLGVALLVAVGLNVATFGNMDNSVRLKLAGLQAEAGALALSVAPARVPDRRNAAILYEKAFAVEKDSSAAAAAKERIWLDRKARIDATRNDAGLSAYLLKNRGRLDLLGRASAMEDCYFEHTYARPSFDMLLPEIQHIRDGARLLRLRAEKRASDGNPRGALEDIRAIRRMAEHIRSEPILISTLVSVACDAIADEALEDVLHLSDPQTDDLPVLGTATIPSYRRAYRRSMIMEEAFGLSAFAMLSADTGDLIGTLQAMQSGATVTVSPPGAFLLSPLAATWRVFALPGELAVYRSRLRQVQQLSLQPYHLAAKRWKNMETQLNTRRSGIMVSLLLPALSRCAETAARAQARRTLANLAVAAEHYRLHKAGYPASAGDLVPTYIPAVPIDPFDGKPLRLVRADGGLVLYSVGPDLKDDSGAEWDRTKKTGDVTFCLGKAFEARRLKAK